MSILEAISPTAKALLAAGVGEPMDHDTRRRLGLTDETFMRELNDAHARPANERKPMTLSQVECWRCGLRATLVTWRKLGWYRMDPMTKRGVKRYVYACAGCRRKDEGGGVKDEGSPRSALPDPRSPEAPRVVARCTRCGAELPPHYVGCECPACLANGAASWSGQGRNSGD
jgi:DNA-directed RNA polymerase subunit RPC12/RpoP